jgi:two-component system NarL family sensor kinase
LRGINQLINTFPAFQKLKIGNKLAVIMILMSILVISIVSSLFYFQFHTALTDRVLMQLSSVAQLKKIQIESLIDREINQVKELMLEIPENGTDESYFFISEDNPLQNMMIPETIQELEAPIDTGMMLIHDLIPSFDGLLILAFTARVQSGAKVTYVLHLPEIQDILMERTGLGLTGESYLVGPDKKMRTLSRFFSDSIPTSITVDTRGVNEALINNQGQGLIQDYRNIEVFSSFHKIQIKNLAWVLLSEIDYEEAMLPLASMKRNLTIILFSTLLIVFISTYIISRYVVKPILSVEGAMIEMSKGKVIKTGIKYSGEDEIAGMITALQNLAAKLAATIQFAQRIGAGNFDAKHEPQSVDDMLGTALVRMANELRQYRKNEELLILQNNKSLIEGQEGERARLSREMHDGIGPALTNLRFQVQALDLDDKISTELTQSIDETINEVRQMSYNLMPSVLLDFGVGDAIQNLTTQLRASTGLDIQFKNSDITKDSFSYEIHLTLYRVTQEALNNAIRHGNPSQIRLSITKFDHHVSLFIADDGKGFDLSNPSGGNGLRNMRERIKLVDGQIDIDSNAERGTTIEVEIPIR